jgi:hypothetical protein
MSGDGRIPEFKIEKWCLGDHGNKESCYSYITTEPNDDDTVTVWKVTIGKKGKINRNRLDILPSRMAHAIDPLSGERKYVALKDDVIVAMAPDYDTFINILRQHQAFAVASTGRIPQYYKHFIPDVYFPLYPGVYDDGFVDPRGFLDEADYGVEQLIKAINWVREFYDEPNDEHAAFLILSSIGKIITPIIRYHDGTFIDQLVWIYGKGGVGKSTTVDYVVRPLLGVPLGMGERANLEYYIVLAISHFSSPNQIRNLLDLNYLPLIIDEQQGLRIRELLAPIITGTIGIGLTGVHASKYGQGIGAQFTARRGWILIANISPSDFIREVLNLNATDEAAARRRIIGDEWAPIIISRDEWEMKMEKNPVPNIMPIYGFIGRLWVKYKDKLKRAGTFDHLLTILIDVIEEEYKNDAKVKEVVNYLREVVGKVEKESTKINAIIETPEEAFIRMSMEFARRYSFMPVNRITALLAILTVPGAVYPTAPKDDEKLVELIEQANRSLDELKRATFNDPNVDKLFEIANALLNDGKPIILVPKDGPVGVLYGTRFLGERANTYSVNGRKITAFPVPVHHLFELFLSAPVAVSTNGDRPKVQESDEDVRINENVTQPEVNEPQVNDNEVNREEPGEKPEEESKSENVNETKGGSGESLVFWVEEASGDYVQGIVEEVLNQVWARWPGVNINDVVEAIIKYIASADKEVDTIDIEKAFYNELSSRLRNAGIKEDELPKVVGDVVKIVIDVLRDRGGLDG